MKCMMCDEQAYWLRSTQFAGDHPFCDLHALMEEDFGENDSYSFWKEIEMKKKMYLVETVSMFRMRYVVEANEATHAEDEVVCNQGELEEFSQKHIDECITSTREISEEEYLRVFNEDNGYLASWSDEQKKKFINTIDYTK